jgi:hypothetical protein
MTIITKLGEKKDKSIAPLVENDQLASAVSINRFSSTLDN